jgi:hypothetical protein
VDKSKLSAADDIDSRVRRILLKGSSEALAKIASLLAGS